MYSQNNEEEIILNYFKDIGRFLDIGAYDGVNLSNTRALSERGWGGICLEPSPRVYQKLFSNYETNDKVKCYKYALGNSDGTVNFWDNENAVATMCVNELTRWQNEMFIPIEVTVKTFETFYKENPFTFDFISLDAEGMDFDILKQIDLNKVGCKMLIVEWNGKEQLRYVNYVTPFGLKLIHANAENLIFAL
jgi:FkbM family methyltransferase